MTTRTDRERPGNHVYGTDDGRLTTLIGNLLRVAVAASLTLLVVGTVLMFAQRPEYIGSPERLAGLLAGEAGGLSMGAGVVWAGLVVLVAGPVLRVVTSVLVFAWRRDWVYAGIAGTVMVLLGVSFVVGLLRRGM